MPQFPTRKSPSTTPIRAKSRRAKSKGRMRAQRRLRCETLEDRRMMTVNFIRSDLDFILQQTLIAEQHAAGADLTSLIATTELAHGLRTVDGSDNNLIAGRDLFGAADTIFQRLVDPAFRNADAGTSYLQTEGLVIDSQLRLISNLIVDQTPNNPAAVAAAANGGGELVNGTRTDGSPFQTFFIPNTAPDEGLSAPFNAWMTFFGQFFDHGLDLVTKGGSGTVMMPLQPDDPLFDPGEDGIPNTADDGPNFMLLTRATNQPGPDGVLGTFDDIHEHSNTTTPFVDQNQTYTSHPSHQVFLRAYEFNVADEPVATGKLIVNCSLGADGQFGTLDDVMIGGMATWAVIKAQARDLLGIQLVDADVFNVPLISADAYGNFLRGPNGFPQIVTTTGVVEGDPTANGGNGVLVPANALRTGHAFLDDIAHTAVPTAGLSPDADDVAGGQVAAGFYDNELLDAHYIAGDGRANENIGLTAVHHVFHSEHNRLVDHTKQVILQSGDVAFLNHWLTVPVAAIPADISTLEWNGERLFQAAKFGTEMQYQHLVFEEFARTVQPNIDVFLDFNDAVNPSIVAEFAHTVYRFGHSMLNETIDRRDPTFVSSEIGLIQAFLNPLAFADSGPSPDEAAGAIVRGVTRQTGNAIDEFVTEALRNNLLGLPLDLPTINLARGRDTGVPTLNVARRDFHSKTGDNQLTPYVSWSDFVQHMKHPESLVNFVAAYGTHSSITDAVTLDEKRQAASLLVLGGVGEPADRLDFLNSTGAWANAPGNVPITGLEDIDLWIGGLAEQIMPFGGMLGSTFNFVFETQLEALQNGDRFYYLHRTPGLNFLTELENNSFSKMVMANTDAKHLPALMFTLPGLILEVDPTRQFNAGLDGADPVGPDPQFPIVIRDNPSTPGSDTDFLQYTGDQHVVLGGTEGADILVSSIGDDTLWGDGGNDRLDGGFGNDTVEAGPGDDIITDLGGDDVLKGDDGNDVIHGGNGINLILAGAGSDFIVTGEDFSETFAGPGNDFILGTRLDAFPFGNEGHDWLEIGLQDGAAGDNFDPLGLDGVVGHDVFIGDGGFDETLGEGGDDIAVGSAGPDKHKLASGFDWVTFKDDVLGVRADLFKDALNDAPLPASLAAIDTRFAQVEGLSGSAFADILRGDNADAALIVTAGATGSVLTNLDLITGLRAFLGSAAAGPDGIVGTADDQFGAGNILLGGDGSDIIEGRGGDDIIDGDRWLNVRISVRQNADGSGPEIRSVNSMKDLVPDMLSGAINPGQLVIVRELLSIPSTASPDFDTAVFSDIRDNYTISTAGGVTTVTHLVVPVGGNAIVDGTDRLTGIERLQFADQAIILVGGLNEEPAGQVAILDTANVPDATPVVGQTLRASIAGVTDADNPGGGVIPEPVSYTWQFERVPGSGVFQDITLNLAPRGGAIAVEPTFTVPQNLEGFALRVKAHYQDAHGVLEIAFSNPTAPVAPGTPAPGAQPLLTNEQPGVVSPGIHFLGSDLQFILDQIKISEQHAAGADLLTLIPNARMALGLRTVDGSLNNLVGGQSGFGAADEVFPRLASPVFRDADDGTSYMQTTGIVIDVDPRMISNLIVDQTASNPAAIAAAAAVGGELVSGTRADGTPFQTFFIPNTAPDEGLSAGFNAWMTFFGQFFDHGLDLVTKGGSGTVFMPLQPDDPLFDAGVDGIPNTADDGPNFMVLNRATNLPGPDGVLGTADDIHEHMNTTTPFVDQNQTYTSHPAHQVFLRAYEFNALGQPVTTGKLIVDRDLGPDGIYGTVDDIVIGGMASWKVVKAQARDILGIALTDADVFNVPLVATDAYGNFVKGPNGFPQVVMKGPDGLPGTGDDVLVEGAPNAPISLIDAVKTGHAFLDDIAHTAAPAAGLAPDDDALAGGPVASGFYDNELLEAHYIAGDGRANENIGLTTVHHVFHSEHNRLVDHTKDVLLATTVDGDVTFLNEWLLEPVTEVPADLSTLVWNGERLFQAAKFGTEMQYQHLVFEEFARTIQPQIDVFIPNLQNYQAEINPAIFAEFAHTVYRLGHSMLTETIDRLDPNFGSSEIGLIQAFLNPLAFAASGPSPDEAAGAIVRGVTRQVGNEIDEFVTEALRNNLLGLPLDLPAINLARGRDTGVPPLNAARREFHALTGDSQLVPYTSWADFVQHMKHPESLINFIAAYGTHPTIVSATNMSERRDAASLLVLGGVDAPADRFDFLNSTGAWAAALNGITTTGLDEVDLWVGGLAEKIMPFGGMLGSTFNFVFETQLESLQNGDRFYYLERTAGLNFVTELENNSFAKVIMNATDAAHLPALVFQTAGLILEVDQTKQYNPSVIPGLDGILGTADDLPANADPAGDGITPPVIRDNPATVGPDTNYVQYTGGEHVVLGGTNGVDILIGSIGDDTLWGDGGNDRLEGGDGNDSIRGGPGDDIITDVGGDDNIQGDDGHDVIHAGNGVNLVLGGFGNDFIVTGEDASEAFGGPGHDFILGSDNNEQDMGNEGDDWLEGGLLDGSPGDNFDPLGRDLIIGNDVYYGSGLADIMNAEGGDDIMIGSAGPGDKYLGASGFDWATFKDDPFGVSIDMDIRALDAGPIPAAAGLLARFAAVEGLSGSPLSDYLQGDNADALTIPTAGLQGSVLTNIALINGLQEFLGAGVSSFGSGNIILGGSGSDIIEGRGGDDLIDGDKWLNVRISVRANADGTGPEIDTFDSMVPLVPLMLNGTYSAGQLRIVREILPGNAGFDTAVFSDVLANYDITTVEGVTTVTHLVVTGGLVPDGTDRLTNIERLQFADQAVVLVAGKNAEPAGLLAIDDTTPTALQTLTASPGTISDADGLGPVSYVWQFEPVPGTGVYQDIQTFIGVGVARAMGPKFTVTPNLVGLTLRVRGVYQDQNGVLENVYSAPTAPVAAAPTAPAGITVSAVGSLTTTEAGTSDTFAIVLNSAPTADVTINVSSSDLTEAVVSPASITFTPANWDQPQTVTVTGVQDTLMDGSVALTIVTAAAISADTRYQGLNATDLSAINQDDDIPEVLLSLTGSLLAEAGGVAVVSAHLSFAAPQDVIVNLAFGGTATNVVDFTPSASNIVIPAGQLTGSITITAVPDVVDEADETIIVSIDSTNGSEVGQQEVTTTIADAHIGPAVVSAVVNGGGVQRSAVRSLVVTFSEPINVLGILPGAFSITRHGGTAVESILVNWSAGDTIATLTWSGAGTTGGSLNDGDYSLTVDHTKLTDLALNALDGDAGTAGLQDYVFGANEIDSFFRLFGDMNGNRVVNTIDYLAFRQSYGKSELDPEFNAMFDYNGDGVVNTVDYLAFRQRYGLAFPYTP